MTKCTVTNGYGTITIEAEEEAELHDLMEGLVANALYGMGYAPKSVDEYIYGKDA